MPLLFYHLEMYLQQKLFKKRRLFPFPQFSWGKGKEDEKYSPENVITILYRSYHLVVSIPVMVVSHLQAL
jgi:hypothetical protein